MSKVGNKPIELSDNVKVTVDGKKVTVKGPKGEMDLDLPRNIGIEVKEKEITLAALNGTKETKALHGTYRALLANNVSGVTEEWTKKLELVGTGYRAELKGTKLVVHVGYSHPVEFEAPEGIRFTVEKSIITIMGVDKELVGLTAARIRKSRPPEPYKGKGIRYVGELVRRKAGKAAKSAD